MADGPEVPGEWDLSGSGEPPAALLRRAISHVESLLHRLDPADAATPAPADDGAALAAAPALAVATAAPARARARAFDETHSSTAQADAMRISLQAHEQKHRLHAQANGARAEAAAEGERILVEARGLTDRMRADARDSVAEVVGVARREAAVVIDAARYEADRIRQASLADDGNRRADFGHAAERDRAMATDAVRGMLAGAHASVDEVRVAMRRLVDTLNESLTSLDASASSIESLLASVDAYADPPQPSRSAGPERAADPVPATPESAAIAQFAPEQRTVASRWAEEQERRPLGLLFGTQGA